MKFRSFFCFLRSLPFNNTKRPYEGALNFLPPKSLDDEFLKILKNKGLDKHQLKWALDICEAHQNEVHIQKSLLEKHRLSSAGWTLDYQLLGMDSFYACARKMDSTKHAYQIRSSVAIPIILLSVAIELNFYLEGKSNKYFTNKKLGSSINSWFSYLQNNTCVNREVFNWALDASLLLYFHEVAHILFGHCSYACKNDDELRALELDADFNAGTMFGCLLDGIADENRKPSGVEEFSRRLIRASILLGIVMKAVSEKSDKYHYPTTRTMMFNAGFAFALDHNSMTPNFSDEAEGNQYWGNKITIENDKIYAALKMSTLSYFAGTERDLEIDVKKMKTKTIVVRNRLKEGPLKNMKCKI